MGHTYDMYEETDVSAIVNRLEETAADLTNKEAALFVPSGTMGNLLGLLVSARSGQEVIADADSHLFLNEAAGARPTCGTHW
jgi:threonine aldolase